MTSKKSSGKPGADTSSSPGPDEETPTHVRTKKTPAKKTVAPKEIAQGRATALANITSNTTNMQDDLLKQVAEMKG